MRSFNIRFFLCMIIAVGIFGCRALQPSSVNNNAGKGTVEDGGEMITPSIGAGTIQDTAPTDTPMPSISFQPLTPRILPDGGALESQGPWMMLESGAAFWFVSVSGDELGFFPVPPPFSYGTALPAPRGALLGLVLSDYGEKIKVLQVYSLTENKVLYEQDLLDYTGGGLSFDNDQDARDFEADREAAVGQMAWSSDGAQLAFISSHAGPSPDLYVLDVNSWEVRRLTSGPSHAVGLNWSPDNADIFHAGVDKMYVGYSGAGYQGWVFYAAAADGSEVITTGEGMGDMGGETTVGWYSPQQALMVSDFWWCGMFDMRMVNIKTGEKSVIWKSQFDDFAYAPAAKKMLVWSSAGETQGKECGSKYGSGLYMLDLPSGDPEKLMDFPEETIVEVTYSEAGNLFKVKSVLPKMPPEWMTVDMDGRVENYDGEPFFSPDGGSYALLDPSQTNLQVFLANGSAYVVVQGGEVLFPEWVPDGSGLFYFLREIGADGRFDLYFWTPSPESQANPVYSDFFGKYDAQPIWVFP